VPTSFFEAFLDIAELLVVDTYSPEALLLEAKSGTSPHIENIHLPALMSREKLEEKHFFLKPGYSRLC
jgi:hypothetical protein